MSNNIKCTICSNAETTLTKVKNLYICKDCINLLHEKMNENEEIVRLLATSNRKPSDINALLDEYVIGQNVAKDKLSVAIYNHQKMLKFKEKYGDKAPVDIEKSNVLLVGPTGSGKTFMLKTLAKKLGIPLAIQDATSLTESGYVGDDVENCLLKLIQAADYDIEKAQTGIVYIDEIDKIGRKGENMSISRDVSGEGVQQALLKIVEGTVASVPPKGGRKHPNQQNIQIDTTNILFIVGGSFEGIEKRIAKRKQGKSTMGIGAKIVDTNNTEFNEFIHDITTEDLKKFGMTPEFLGRFPIIATLEELDEEALLNILTEPKNALVKQYQALFEVDNIELEFTEGALKSIARKAIATKTGARGLRAILDEVLLATMHSAPDENLNKVIVEDDLSITKIAKDNSKAV